MGHSHAVSPCKARRCGSRRVASPGHGWGAGLCGTKAKRPQPELRYGKTRREVLPFLSRAPLHLGCAPRPWRTEQARLPAHAAASGRVERRCPKRKKTTAQVTPSSRPQPLSCSASNTRHPPGEGLPPRRAAGATKACAAQAARQRGPRAQRHHARTLPPPRDKSHPEPRGDGAPTAHQEPFSAHSPLPGGRGLKSGSRLCLSPEETRQGAVSPLTLPRLHLLGAEPGPTALSARVGWQPGTKQHEGKTFLAGWVQPVSSILRSNQPRRARPQRTWLCTSIPSLPREESLQGQ